MQDHIGHGQHVGQLLLLHPKDTALDLLPLGRRFCLSLQVLDGTSQEAPRTARRIEDRLTELGVDDVDDELGDGPRRVEFARVPGTLQVFEELLVDVVELMTLSLRVEIDLVQLVDHLPEQGAVLHVVVGVFEDRTHHQTLSFSGSQPLELGKESVVDEVEQRITRDAFIVRCPLPPTELLGDGRLVVVAFHLPFLLPGIEHLQEEHPAKLADALGVTIDASVLPHDILDALDQTRQAHVSLLRRRSSLVNIEQFFFADPRSPQDRPHGTFLHGATLVNGHSNGIATGLGQDCVAARLTVHGPTQPLQRFDEPKSQHTGQSSHATGPFERSFLRGQPTIRRWRPSPSSWPLAPYRLR